MYAAMLGSADLSQPSPGMDYLAARAHGAHELARNGRQKADVWVFAAICLLVVLNLFDAFLTILWVDMGVAREANVLLQPILERSPLAFFVVKMGIVVAALSVLWAQRQRRIATLGLSVSCVAYSLLLIYHVYIGYTVLG